MNLLELLFEEQIAIYSGMIRVSYTEGMNVTDIEDIIRGIEGVTIVNSSGDEEELNRVILKIKIRTFETGGEAGFDSFVKVRQDAVKHQGIERVEIATKSIERVR